jgi:hypothetical protein
LYLKDCHFALFLGPKPEVYTKRQILSVSGALFYNPAFFIKLICILIEQWTGEKIHHASTWQSSPHMESEHKQK